MKKAKQHVNPISELHFIASISLEESVFHIGSLADDAHTITLTEVDENTFKFHIDYILDQSPQSEINGTLRRWQGTETRIDATGSVVRTFKRSTYHVRRTMRVVTGSMCFFGGSILLGAPIAGKLLGIGLWGFGIKTFRQLLSEVEFQAPSPVHFRQRDRLLQLVIDAFKAAGEVRPL